MSAFAASDAGAINKAGVVAFEASGMVANITAALSAGNTTPEPANAALQMVKSLCESCDQWIEPYMVTVLPGECVCVLLLYVCVCVCVCMYY
jgi:hypothetical protein